MISKKKLTIGIIGFGNFGSLVASILSEHFTLLIYDYKNKPENKKQAEVIGVELVDLKKIVTSDIIILVVPISKTKDVVKKIAPLMKRGALIMDTCSVKVYPCEWLKKYVKSDIQIMGTHPMFGPTTSKFNLENQKWNLANLQIVLCPLRIKDQYLIKIKEFLSSLGLKIITTTPEEHDRQNAKTLSFVHFIGRSLLSAGIGKQEIYTRGYTDLLSILPHTTSDNWQLFYDMNNYNPYADVIREKFRDAGFAIEGKIIKNRNKNELEKNRDMINIIDTRIMKLLKKRFECSKKIGAYKKERDSQIIDSRREFDIIKEKRRKYNLDNDFIEKFYKLIFNESRKQQK